MTGSDTCKHCGEPIKLDLAQAALAAARGEK